MLGVALPPVHCGCRYLMICAMMLGGTCRMLEPVTSRSSLRSAIATSKSLSAAQQGAWIGHTHCLIARLRNTVLLPLSQYISHVTLVPSQAWQCVQGSSSLPKDPIDKHHKTGVMFLTYSLLIASLKKGDLQSIDEQNRNTNAGSDDLPTLELLGVNKGSRLAQIVTWLRGRDGKGECLVILDECHKAKNLIAKEGEHSCRCCPDVARPHVSMFVFMLIASTMQTGSQVTALSIAQYNLVKSLAHVCRTNHTDWKGCWHPARSAPKCKGPVQQCHRSIRTQQPGLHVQAWCGWV